VLFAGLLGVENYIGSGGLVFNFQAASPRRKNSLWKNPGKSSDAGKEQGIMNSMSGILANLNANK
jgi:hypothetical protein